MHNITNIMRILNDISVMHDGNDTINIDNIYILKINLTEAM